MGGMNVKRTICANDYIPGDDFAALQDHLCAFKTNVRNFSL
jgi:hypothetical protein